MIVYHVHFRYLCIETVIISVTFLVKKLVIGDYDNNTNIYTGSNNDNGNTGCRRLYYGQ